MDILNSSSIEAVYFLVLSLGALIFYIFNEINKNNKDLKHSIAALYSIIQEDEKEIIDFYTRTYLKGAEEILKDKESIKIRTTNLRITVEEIPETDNIKETDYNIKLKG